MKAVIAILLTFTAGIVDIVGYMTVYHLFVAHMTGATVHLGNKFEIGAWPDVARAFVIIASFVAGSVAGRAVIEAGARGRNRTVASMTMAAEALLVLAFVRIGAAVLKQSTPETIPVGISCLLLGLLAAAMGLQTATLTRIGPLTIHTTFVTGMLNKLAQEGARWLFWIHDSWRENGNIIGFIGNSRKQTSFRNAAFMGTIWFSYAVGSIAGTWMDSRWKIAALYLPVCILLASIVVDQLQPLSLEEEKDQI
ncbi:MAG TPA: YoaK family protein [Candidatus Eisenbacteria bacterium]|nr:YoaK family protein [Candidatus Eisenbacteria bacterium]